MRSEERAARACSAALGVLFGAWALFVAFYYFAQCRPYAAKLIERILG